MYIRNPITNEWEEVFLPPTGDTYPIGMYGWFAGEKAPTNWLRCDGQEISRTEYKELFNAIGTTYGVGDGSTTFNLPNVNLENRTLVGSSGDGEFSVGNTGGEKEHTLTIDEMPSHKHGVGYVGGNANGNHAGMPGTSAEPNSYNNELFINSKGGDQPHNNMQPYMASVCCIKAKQSVGLVGNVVSDMNAQGDNDVANAKTVKSYIDLKTNRIKLWENSSTSSVMPQNATLNFSNSDYDEIEVVFRRTNVQNMVYTTGRIPKGYNIALNCYSTSSDANAWLRDRLLERISDTQYKSGQANIQFTNETKYKNEDGACIPIVIYGYKGGEVVW